MSQPINDETIGFTASLRPEVTNGANEVDAKRPPFLTYKDNAHGDMEGQSSVDDAEDEGNQVDSGKLYPLSDRREADTNSFGNPQ